MPKHRVIPIFFVLVISQVLYGKNSGWLDVLDAQVGAMDQTVLDFPYEVDQRDFPMALKFKEQKKGKRNKLNLLDQLEKDVREPKNLQDEFATLRNQLVETIEEHKSTSLSDKQKSILIKWNETIGARYSKIAQDMKDYDYCQVNLNMAGHVTNITAIADSTRFYMYASLLDSDLNKSLPLRVENMTRMIQSMQECKPTIIAGIIAVALKAVITDFTKTLLLVKKISKQTAARIVMTLGTKAQMKRDFVDMLRREFWIASYLSAKLFASKISDTEKEYSKKFPDDKNRLFDESKMITQGASCISKLIEAVEKEKFVKSELESCHYPQVPADLRLQLEVKSWDNLHRANQKIPGILTTHVQSVFMSNFAAKVENFLQDMNLVEAAIKELR